MAIYGPIRHSLEATLPTGQRYKEFGKGTVVFEPYVAAGAMVGNAPDTWTLGVELNGENRKLAITPQVRKGLTGTGALAASLGVSIPVKYRGEKVVSWVGYLLWEFLEPLRARR